MTYNYLIVGCELFGSGRLAEYKYYDMDDTIEKALSVTNSL
jgi:UDP-galactopyranose mutase